MFKIVDVDFKDSVRCLDAEASGKVKSKKNFPVFLIDGMEYIFKPLSKTKPFATPTFSMSEVFWSNIINKYFDSSAPIYQLSICNGLEDNISKYRNNGSLVLNVLGKNQKFVNLLEYFKSNPDSQVDINNYINYCGMFYDYKCIFNSKLISENNNLGEQLAKQVLLSILRGDINYHYENVNLIFEDDKIVGFAPPIDHEFSIFFLYSDLKGISLLNLLSYSDVLKNGEVLAEYDGGFPLTNNKKALLDNINLIVSRYPNVVLEFIDNIDNLLNDIYNMKFNIDERYLYPFSSFDFEEYKKGTNLAQLYNPTHSKFNLNTKEFMKEVINNIVVVSSNLEKLLQDKLNKKHEKIKK